MAVLTINENTTLYLESSVLLDWFLARTVESKEFKEAASDKIMPSYTLIENFLSDPNQYPAACSTSDWALAEAVSVIRRARIELSMFLDVVPLRFYDRVKDTPRYALTSLQIEQIKEQLANFRKRARKRASGKIPIKILPSIATDYALEPFITGFGLDSEDAFHLAIATGNLCDVFVTRDNDFASKKELIEKEIKGHGIKIAAPAFVLNSLKALR